MNQTSSHHIQLIRDYLSAIEATPDVVKARLREALRAADALQSATEEAWRVSNWSAATERQRTRSVQRYHEARESYSTAREQLSAMLGGVHAIEIVPSR